MSRIKTNLSSKNLKKISVADFYNISPLQILRKSDVRVPIYEYQVRFDEVTYTPFYASFHFYPFEMEWTKIGCFDSVRHHQQNSFLSGAH